MRVLEVHDEWFGIAMLLDTGSYGGMGCKVPDRKLMAERRWTQLPLCVSQTASNWSIIF